MCPFAPNSVFFLIITSSIYYLFRSKNALSDYRYDRKRFDISSVNCEGDNRTICSVGKFPPGITVNVSLKYRGSSAPDRAIIPPISSYFLVARPDAPPYEPSFIHRRLPKIDLINEAFSQPREYILLPLHPAPLCGPFSSARSWRIGEIGRICTRANANTRPPLCRYHMAFGTYRYITRIVRHGYVCAFLFKYNGGRFVYRGGGGLGVSLKFH